MKVLFWNIGKRFNNSKSEYLTQLISEQDPDIICIAEGTYSEKECEFIERTIIDTGFSLFYSPNVGKEKLIIPFNRNGLKVFYKDITPKEDFGFQHLRENGRIISIQFRIRDDYTTFIFLHNYSKNGNREYTLEQSHFISAINLLIINSKLNSKESKVVIVGDFNLEPWDNILRHSKHIDSYFLINHLEWAKEKSNRKNSILFNPITEKLIQERKLRGTFYSKSYGWALYDFPIYNEETMNIQYDIIELINKQQIIQPSLKKDNEIDFDHLPITLKID